MHRAVSSLHVSSWGGAWTQGRLALYPETRGNVVLLSAGNDLRINVIS